MVRLFVLLCFLLPCGSCDAITAEQVQGLAASFNNLNQTLDQYQQTTNDTLAKMVEQKQLSQEAFDKTQKVSAEVDKVQDQVGQIAAAITSVKPTGDQVQDLIAVVREANRVSAPWNPYSGFVEIGLGLLAAIAGVFWKKASSEAKQNAEAATVALAKYQAHKQGVEAAKAELAAAAEPVNAAKVAAVIYSNIGDARARLGVT